jgi:hypothetical protein
LPLPRCILRDWPGQRGSPVWHPFDLISANSAFRRPRLFPCRAVNLDTDCAVSLSNLAPVYAVSDFIGRKLRPWRNSKTLTWTTSLTGCSKVITCCFGRERRLKGAARACSSGQQTRQAGPAAGVRDQVPLHQGPRHLHQPAHPPRTGGPHQDLRFVPAHRLRSSLSALLASRGHPRAVLRPSAALRVRRLPARGQLPLPGRLRRQGQAVARNHLPPLSLQGTLPVGGQRACLMRATDQIP